MKGIIFALSLYTFLLLAPQSIFSTNCEYPNLSQGDVNLTRQTYQAFKAEHDIFVLGISDSECESCCWKEGMLHDLDESLKNNRSHFLRGKPIQIGRIDMKEARHYIINRDISPDLSIPAILVYNKGAYHAFDGWPKFRLILNLINRVLYPLVPLKTRAELNIFTNYSAEYHEKTNFFGKDGYRSAGLEFLPPNQIRIVLLISDKAEYKDDIKKVTEAAKRLAIKVPFRLGLITNRKLVKELKAEYNKIWFDQYSYNSLVIFREGGTFYTDVETMEFDYYRWIYRNSLDLMAEMNRYTTVIFRELNIPGLIVFDDYSSVPPTNNSFIKLFKRIAPDYQYYVAFFYSDVNKDKARIKSLGLSTRRTPIIVILLVNGKNIVFPQDKLINQKNIIDFLNDFLQDKLTQKESKFSKLDQVAEYDELLKNTNKMQEKTYFSQVLREQKDVLVLFYYSKISDSQIFDSLDEVDKVARFFRENEISSVKICSYDLYIYDPPKNISIVPNVPYIYIYTYMYIQEDLFIYLFPADSKDKESIMKYDQAINLENLVNYIYEHGDIHFRKPKQIKLKNEDVKPFTGFTHKPNMVNKTNTAKKEDLQLVIFK